MTFDERYKQLNDAQKTAVDTIDGPLMVVAGPGTGKTELLSMRVANILRLTDTLPNNILCLTFTESGAAAMRERLASIIGPDAYKVAIHTFHSFGTDIMSRYNEYFYNGAQFTAASETETYEILRGIFESLPHSNPISAVMNGDFVYLKDVQTTIAEFKKSSLTSDEILRVLDANEQLLDVLEPGLSAIFSSRLAKSTKDTLRPFIAQASQQPFEVLPPGLVPLQQVFALSLAHAIDAADDTNSTKPLTTWRNEWLEKNHQGFFVFKDRKRIKKLRAAAFVYQSYVSEMQSKSLYDFDDMVLETVHALEVINELRFNLQEQYLYIMVDEFQDTNLAQARLLASLADSPVSEGAPNLMVVGDDDQAIYSFQGAELSNILQFNSKYETTKQVTLRDNYRSTSSILESARQVIVLGGERLEIAIPDLDKSLTAHSVAKNSKVSVNEFTSMSDERAWIVQEIAELIQAGTEPSSISVIARRHHELVALLPYFAEQSISLNYERRENVLESNIVVQLEMLARLIDALAGGDHELANSYLPEILAHPAWNISPTDLWKLSLKAQQHHSSWMEEMEVYPAFQAIHSWLLVQAKNALHTPLEAQLDELIGRSVTAEDTGFISPLYVYYFSDEARQQNFESYLTFLEALRTIRDHIRNHSSNEELHLADFLEFIDLQRELGVSLTAVRARALDQTSRVNLMTAHKSKGLEFDHVFVIGAVDSAWGERVRSRSRLIQYPKNLPLAPAGGSYDERLRLFFVAMTRAKRQLSISYSTLSDTGVPLMPASFLDVDWARATVHVAPTDVQELVRQTELAWYQPLIRPVVEEQAELLRPLLDRYKLSATHLNSFLDVTRGGPQYFLLHNLLRFPEAMSPNAAYGSAIHRTLQQAHQHFSATDKKRPMEDIIGDFETNLTNAHLSKRDEQLYSQRGVTSLEAFFGNQYDTFSVSSKSELNFSGQQSIVSDAHLTGSLDLVDINTEQKTIRVTDYKTGKSAANWRGISDHEKLKLHKYRQQLMFYKLLIENSRDYDSYTVDEACLQFVEPSESGDISALEIAFDTTEYERFTQLVLAVWERIKNADFIDTAQYDQTYSGVLKFEAHLLDN